MRVAGTREDHAIEARGVPSAKVTSASAPSRARAATGCAGAQLDPLLVEILLEAREHRRVAALDVAEHARA